MGHGSLVKVRSSVVLPVRLAAHPSAGWHTGPLALPLAVGSGSTTTDLRATYFDDRAARALYGTDEAPVRWHRTEALPVLEGFGLSAIELLDLSSAATPSLAVLVLHLVHEHPNDLDALRPWLNLKWAPGQPPSPMRSWVNEKLPEVADVPRGWGGRALTLTYAEPGQELDPGPFGATGWDAAEEWLFALASGASPDSYTLDETMRSELLAHRIPFSADWEGLVLRDGISLLARRPRQPPEDPDYLDSAALYAATIYTDVLVLGLAQQVGLAFLADGLARVADPSESFDDVLALETAFSSFRNTYWWQHLTQHGRANQLLDAFHEQRRLPGLLAQVGDELGDYARQAEIREARRNAAADARTNRFLALLAVVGVPLALAPTVHDLLPAETWWRKPVAALAGGLVFVALVVVTEVRKLTAEWWQDRGERE